MYLQWIQYEANVDIIDVIDDTPPFFKIRNSQFSDHYNLHCIKPSC